MPNTLIQPSTLYLGETTLSGSSAAGTVLNSSNSTLTTGQAWTDPAPSDVGGMDASNTSDSYRGNASTLYAENHPNDDVYLELGEGIRIDRNADGDLTDEPWLRITEIARYGGTQIQLSDGTVITGAVNLVTAVGPGGTDFYQTILFGDDLVANINAVTEGGGVAIARITLGNYVGYGGGTADLTQVMLASNFDSEVFSEDVEIICFANGSQIETELGPRPVEQLNVGDLVATKDQGLMPIRWIGRKNLDAATLKANPGLFPIRIGAGALGKNNPDRDLLVSPQHRVLVNSKIARRMFGSDEVLVAAKHLTALENVEVATDVAELAYFHILVDGHEIVTANNLACETLFPGPITRKNIGDAAWEEVTTLFPDLLDPDFIPNLARTTPSGRKAAQLILRHQKNETPLVNSDVAA
ncbi:Hint domain-containing protein [Paracoccus tegillarcae]|nr:Hint domain-containing protein [Paracoccus tegillarcae]